MKHCALLVISAVVFCSMFAAGCVSLGPVTSDIICGDEKIGQITLTPADNLFSSEGSLADKFNMQVEIGGLIFNRDGVTMSDAADISTLLNAGDFSALNGFIFLAGDVENTDLTSLAKLFENTGNLNLADSQESLDAAGENMQKLINGIAGTL
ncbi:MAG TPA: hypothetical protein O0X70_03480 [Methanocorpusculum sp.]|nr:hypothetical protein [Methanocorpusculum sp.]